MQNALQKIILQKGLERIDKPEFMQYTILILKVLDRKRLQFFLTFIHTAS